MRTVNFYFWLDVDVDEAEIWPDGNAPEDWTVNDVAKVVEEEGGPFWALTDWTLFRSINLNIVDTTGLGLSVDV